MIHAHAIGVTRPDADVHIGNAGSQLQMTVPSSRSRRRQITRTAMTGVLAKATALLPTLGIAPIAATTLGPERFGVLMTVLSLMAFLQLADLGVGGNLVTGISRAVGAGKRQRVLLLQWNGLAIVSVMALVLACAAVPVAFSHVGALVFPRGSINVQHEASLSLAAFLTLFALGMPLTVITKVQLGMQQGHVANIWQSGGALINFAAGACVCLQGGTVPMIIVGLMSGTLLCGVANAVGHVRQNPEAQFAKGSIRRSVVRRILSGSLSYLTMQIIFLVTYAVDTLIVARNLGAEDASGYAIAERLFSIVAVAVGIVTAPLWSAYGEALGKKDLEWARHCLRTSLWRFALLSSLMCGALVAAFGPLVTLLGAGAVHVSLTVAAAMAAWRIVESVGNAIAVYMYASEKVQFVLCCGIATAVVSLYGKTQLVGRFGPAALPLTTLVCFTCLCLIPSLIYVSKRQPLIKSLGQR